MTKFLTIFFKEWHTEKRTPSSLYASHLFSLLTVTSISFASHGFIPSPSLAAGMFCATLFFSAIIALPRTFLIEDDQSTFDLTRLLSSPTTIFLGKTLYNFLQLSANSLILSLLFVLFTGIAIHNGYLFIGTLVSMVLSSCAGIGLCSAVAIGSPNKWLLATILSLPLMLPQVAMGVGAFRVAFGEGTLRGGIQNLIGLYGFALALLMIGPILVTALWKNDQSL